MDVIIVDDSIVNRTLLVSLAKRLTGCNVHRFARPHDALEWCLHHTADLVIVDYMMPDLNGVELIGMLRSLPDYTDVPIVMVTASEARSVRNGALLAGATDFLSRPVDRVEFLARCRNLLALRRHSKMLSDQAGWLREEVEKAVHEVHQRELDTLMHLSKAAEFRDPETGSHIVRMAHYAKAVANAMGLPGADQEVLLAAAPMHDVGKLGTPDNILLKPGKLTLEEFETMKQHATHGWEILRHGQSKVIKAAALIAYTHHEKWDGTGYPRGLRGEDIPMFGRIVAVADVFDALTTRRPYKEAWPDDQACAHLRDQAGKHFDPAVVEAFFVAWGDICNIRRLYRDAHSDDHDTEFARAG